VDREVAMGGVVVAKFIIGANSGLTREQVDKIIEILDLVKDDGTRPKPPVGQNCNYQLVLEKADQDVPANGGPPRR
jgi:hypothetical protein